MLLTGCLMCHLRTSEVPHTVLKRSMTALPKLRATFEKTVPLGFAKAEGFGNIERKLKLVIRPAPEDGWYIVKPNSLLKSYMQLSKARLTALISATTVGGFIMAPVDLSLSALVACIIGTTLLSASANTLNHLLETPYDAQMKRTQSRLLVVHRFSSLHALSFALSTAASGTAILWIGCNSLTAALGLLNAFLYAGVYTPMKRYSIGCTWVGAIVGAIPPIIGFAGATASIQPASLVMAALLYCWQFPHFNALSWNMRDDYTRAGYRVMCAINQRLCRLTSLRYSVAFLLICSLGVPSVKLTDWFFAAETFPFNGLLFYLSYNFYRRPDAKTSRILFHYTLLHLPLIMMLMTVNKFGGS